VKGHAGFRLNALISLVPNATWAMLAQEFLQAKSDPAELQVFTNTILGQGWAKEGYSASTLDPTVRGVGWLLAEGAVPRKIRTHYLDDDTIAGLARRASTVRGRR